MKQSFVKANFWLLILSAIIMFISHWFRSVRWQYLLKPIRKIPVTNLFSALLIGYMGNSLLPAHLGEFFRAYVIGHKQKIPVSSILATIVIERIIDLFTLLLIMAFALIVYPFPDWVTKSGYIIFIVTICMFLFLIFLKKYTYRTVELLNRFLKILPQIISHKIITIINAFVDGVRKLKHKKDYFIITIWSILIWFCYWFVFHLNFYTFNLIQPYQLTSTSSLVLLVITTISVVVPSSPGYIGTYHFLCLFSLGLFGVPRAAGLTYAITVHGLHFVPVTIIGLILAWIEGLSLIKLSYKRNLNNFD